MQTRFTNRLLAGAGIIACAASFLMAHAASAQTEAITSFGQSSFTSPANFTVGYNFTLSSSVTVTSLGYFDYLANGLAESHNVGIYNSAGTLLFSQLVSGGTTGVLGNTFAVNGANIGGFRYTALGTSQTLAAGTYTIGGFSGTTQNDTIALLSSSVATSSPVTLGVGQAQASPGGLSTTAPVGNQAANSYFGPSFQFTSGPAAAGPEPGTIALFGTGLVSMGGITLRRRKKAAK